MHLGGVNPLIDHSDKKFQMPDSKINDVIFAEVSTMKIDYFMYDFHGRFLHKRVEH